MSSIFDGMPTGKEDDRGKMICCGDEVSYYQFAKGHMVTHTFDGWGNTVPLCRHDEFFEPDKHHTIIGIVTYDPSRTGFILKFDEKMLNSGHKQADLFTIGRGINTEKDRLLVIKSYES